MHRDFPCRRVTHTVSWLPIYNRRKDDSLRCKPQLESLEPRNLMTAAPGADWTAQLSSAVCTCPVCSGQGMNQPAATEYVGSGGEGELAASNPLSFLPLLSSNSSATAKLFLDFNGHTQASWGSYTNVVTPVYDQDGDRTTFSNAELDSIREIWARVAEDYAPYNIDVTTIDPGNSTDRITARIAIGGNYSDWYGAGAGGVAYIGGFYNSAPNVGYVFEDALSNGNARYVAEAASHEAGHLFGLRHHSEYNGTQKTAEYSQGNAAWAPIMGVGYYSTRTTWNDGPSDLSSTAYQDDMAILANASNGFGYRADDYGSTQALASALTATSGNVNMSGRIGTNTDEDWFTFTTGGGAFNLSLNVAQVGANLDSVLELRNATGTVLVTANPTNSFNASISTTLTSGTYYVIARSSGGYGNVGQYTLTGTVPIGAPGGGGENTDVPEIDVLNGTTALQSGGSVSFGSVQVGNYVDRTLTVRNSGTGPLTLTPPTAGNMPAGYTIVSNLGSSTLAAGASTTITIRFTPTATGTTAGTLTLLSDDADEGSFVLNLTGTATPAPAPEIDVLNGTTAVQSGGSVSFGSVQVGNYVDRTLTVRNSGTGPLTLTPPTAGNLPAGYSIVTNFGSSTLAAGASTTITIRFTPTATGTTAGTFTLLSNDADEGSFVLNLTGTATAAPAPEINVLNGTTNVLTGGSISFGTVQVGGVVNKVITIKNSGPGTLTLTPPVAGDMPAGYTIVTNLGSTTLASGASTTITIRFMPTTAGVTAGTFTLLSNDADEGSFVINLTGSATPAPAPEITVLNGTVNVLTGGSVDFGNVQVTKYLDKTITIKNTGNATLTLVKPTAGQMPAGFTIVTNFALTSLAAGMSTTLTVRYTPTAVGTVGGVLTLASNDSDEGSFAINLTGTGTPGPQPEINVNVGTVAVQTGGSIDWGNVQVTKYLDKTITIKNTGPGALTLVKPTALDMPAGFTIVTNFATTSLATNATASITVRYTPTAVGAVGGVLNLVSNDADEGTFALNLTGTGTPAPQPEINVNVGTLAVQSGGSIDWGNVQVTKYLDKTFTIKNTGTAALTLVKPTAAQMPAGFTIVTNFTTTSLAVNASATITVRYTPTAVGAVGGVLNLVSNDADEGTFALNLTGTGAPGPQPEINVNVGTLVVQSGGSIDWGNVQVTKYLDKTITIKNTGPGALTLVKPTAGDLPAGFTIVTNFATTSLATNATATLTVRYTPTAVGAVGGVLNLVSNDADEGTFALNLTGTGTPGPQPEINVNVGTVAIQTGGSIDWGNVQVTKYLDKTITIKNTGPGALTLVKPTALDLPAGFTIVTNFATTSLATNATATITVRYTPTAVGAAGGVLNLVSNDADEGTFALNLTGTGTPAPQPEINVNVGTLVVQSGGSIDWGNVQVTKYLDKTITIKNTGTAALTLVKPTAAQMPAGFTIVTNFAATSLATNATATITVRYTPTAVGAVGGVLNLVSNDADEGTFALNLTGTGTPGPQPEINVNVGTVALQTGGSIDWGNVQVTKYLDKTITIKNTGTAALTLVKPTAAQMPAGFTIVTNFATTSLAVNATATLTVRYTPTAVGAVGGVLNLVSNDADEGTFALNLTGTGTPGPQPEINVNVGTVAIQTGGSIDWGNVQVTKYLDKTFTIKNTGPGALTLVKPTAGDLPAGFTIVTNFATTSLATNATATLTVRYTPTAVGAVGGVLNLVSNDADEGTFALNLTGTGTPGPQPEINVNVGTLVVQSGDAIDWGNVQVTKYLDKTFTIKNTGTAALTLVKPTAAQMPAGFTIVTNFTTTSLAVNASATITVRYTPTAVGAVGGVLNLVSNDADEGTFALNLTGTGTPGPQPEINVNVGTLVVQSGGSIDWGNVQVTKYLDKTFTIKNTGPGALTLVKPTALDMPAGFTIVTNFATTSLATNATATATVRYTPTAVGAVGGVLNLVSNDADEGTFALNLTGTGTPGPQPEINVNVGTVALQTGGSIDWGNVQVTKYLDKTITIKNTGTAALTLVKPTAAQMPAGFTIVTNFTTTSLAVNASATITVRYTPTSVGAVGGVLNLISNDADEGTFALNLTGTGTPGPQPEINVNVGTLAVQSGGTIDWGNVEVGQFVNKVITVKNTGPGALTLVKPTALDLPAGFTIVTNFTTTSLATNATATITLRYTASALGAAGGVLNLVSNDADEGTFALNLTGAGTPAPIIRAIDDGAAGFTSTGTWTKYTFQGRETDMQIALKGNGTTTATWTFTAMPPGVYRVHATWIGSIIYASNAPFTVFDGSTAVGTVLANQTASSTGLTWGGSNWSNLGTFNITGDTVRVTLTNSANNTVVADAVRIERIGDLPGGAALPQGSALLPASNALVSTTASDTLAPDTSPSTIHVFAPLAALSFASANNLPGETIDEVFAAAGDASAELLLLDDALDLLQDTEGLTTVNEENSVNAAAADSLLAEDWWSEAFGSAPL